MIGRSPALVQFAGLTPTEVGLCRVNAGIAKGASIPVTVPSGGVMSNTVTVAVKQALRVTER